MVMKETIKAAIIQQHWEDQLAKPLMNTDTMLTELLAWLSLMKLPKGSEAASWEDLVQSYPTPAGEEEPTTGTKMRLAVRLTTSQNRYLVSILECLEPDSRDTYIIATHVNWQADELKIQQLIDQAYKGRTETTLKSKHTLWAQTFRRGELGEALDRCAQAIIGNELTMKTAPGPEGDRVLPPPTAALRVPSPGDD